jgi:hypothetical protein
MNGIPLKISGRIISLLSIFLINCFVYSAIPVSNSTIFEQIRPQVYTLLPIIEKQIEKNGKCEIILQDPNYNKSRHAFSKPFSYIVQAITEYEKRMGRQVNVEIGTQINEGAYKLDIIGDFVI